MTSTPRTGNVRATGRRLLGAVGTVVAVAVMGVTALTPQTAAAAGISAGHRHVGEEQAEGAQPARPSRGQPAHSTHPGSA